MVSKLLSYGYSSRKLQNIFGKSCGRHIDIVHTLGTSVSHILKDLFTDCEQSKIQKVNIMRNSFTLYVDPIFP